MKWRAAPAATQSAVLGRESLELAVMVRPDVGAPAPPQEIWEKVVGDDARLPGTWQASVRGALEAAHEGDWAVCAYLAARCFQDAGGGEAGAQSLAAPDEAARDRLWLTAVEPLVIEVPKGLERVWVRIDGKESPEWVSTDKLKLRTGSQEQLQLSGNRAGVLAAGPHRSSEHFNLGETVEVSHLEKVLSRPKSAVVPKSPGRPDRQRQSSAPRSRAATDLRRLRLGRKELLELRSLVPGVGGSLAVTLVGASGLRDEDWAPGEGQPRVYCACEISGKPQSRFQTSGVNNVLDPRWNQEAVMSGYTAGDSLSFTIFDQDPDHGDQLLGRGTLAGSQFHANGFDGEVPINLKTGTGSNACVILKISLVSASSTDVLAIPAKEEAPQAEQCPPGSASRRSQSAASSARVPGGVFHVLAYPLGGDFTKVLLRPAKRSVVDGPVLLSMAETLVSYCAKSGQWDLVQTLLLAGVPCPDLEEEFSDICGTWPAVRRRWSRDLAAAVGTQRQSLLGLATAASSDKPLRTMLNVMREQGLPLLLDEAPKGQQSTLLALAEACRWDLVMLLLEEVGRSDGPGFESIVPLAELPVMAKAPPDVLELVHSRVLNEKLAGVRAKSLRDYFERQLQGEVMGKALAPSGFTLCDGVLSTRDDQLQVLDRAVRLRDALSAEDAEVAFVAVSADELAAAVEATADENFAMLPVDLGGKVASQRDPTEPGGWVAVLCPAGYLGKNASGGLSLRIPAGRFPTPYVPRSTLTVQAVTPCCGTPVEGVLLHVDGRRAGVTDADGTLGLMLPAGRHTITSPGQARRGKTVEVKQASSPDETPVQYTLSGELFLYLQDMSLEDEDETRMGVMLTASRDQIPADALPWLGAASMFQKSTAGSGRRKEFNPCARLQEGAACDGALYRMQAHLGAYSPNDNQSAKRALMGFASANKDGFLSSCFAAWSAYAKKQAMGPRLAHCKVKYYPNLDAPVWVGCRHVGNECSAALLFGSPLRLGNLITPAPSRHSTPKHGSHRAGGLDADLNTSLRSMSRSLSESLRTLGPSGAGGRQAGPSATRRPSSSSARSRPPSGGPGRPSARPSTAGGHGRRPPRPKGGSARPSSGGGPVRACCDPRSRPMFFDPYEVDFVYAS